MTVLGIIMLSGHEISESDLSSELETLDFSVKQSSELLKTLKDEGFIERYAVKNASNQVCSLFSCYLHALAFHPCTFTLKKLTLFAFCLHKMPKN